MNFTDTDCVGKNWTWYKVFVDNTLQANGQVRWQMCMQVDSQMSEQVNQINPIKYKISQDINK